MKDVFFKKEAKFMVGMYVMIPIIGIIAALVIPHLKKGTLNTETAYEAQTSIVGVTIKAKLVHNHPFLAEYKRFIQIDNRQPIEFGEDTGGFSSINVFKTPTTIVLQAIDTGVMMIDKQNKTTTQIERPLTKSEEACFVGKFTLLKKQDQRNFLFISRKIDPKVSPKFQ